MVVCKRNYEETCDCVYCWAERERRRRAEEEAKD